jgi:hypothetical protein
MKALVNNGCKQGDKDSFDVDTQLAEQVDF